VLQRELDYFIPAVSLSSVFLVNIYTALVFPVKPDEQTPPRDSELSTVESQWRENRQTESYQRIVAEVDHQTPALCPKVHRLKNEA